MQGWRNREKEGGKEGQGVDAAALPYDGSRGNYSLYDIVSTAVSHLCAFIISRHRSRHELSVTSHPSIPHRKTPLLYTRGNIQRKRGREREEYTSFPFAPARNHPSFSSCSDRQPTRRPCLCHSRRARTVSIARAPTNRRIKSGDILHYHEVRLTSCVIRRVCAYDERRDATLSFLVVTHAICKTELMLSSKWSRGIVLRILHILKEFAKFDAGGKIFRNRFNVSALWGFYSIAIVIATLLFKRANELVLETINIWFIEYIGYSNDWKI